ncbi:hypothetical protein KOI35_34225 [Actinoplanes bogorensis]|uniref:Fibronectin type-III domain-containing protein n=1 Tax=Paractinoplanes bogorensis TaxID=1610840 RepID=A0ABS5YYS0_9ACTN|nr:hypothetical protein [Actinoplanes bogorensis]MBU2668582.1 hypothetical protein [Actinoplanes bogorensis]
MTPRRSALVLTGAGLIGVLLFEPAAAMAAWDSSVSDAPATAAAMVLPAMRAPHARVVGESVRVRWSDFTGPALRGYRVTRTDLATGTTVDAGRGCSGVITRTRCAEIGVPAGRWVYAVTALVGDNWRSAAVEGAPVTIGEPTPPPMTPTDPATPAPSPTKTPAPTTPAPTTSAPSPTTPAPEPGRTTPAPELSSPAGLVGSTPSAEPTNPTETTRPAPQPTTKHPTPEPTEPESPKPDLEITAEATPAPSPES